MQSQYTRVLSNTDHKQVVIPTSELKWTRNSEPHVRLVDKDGEGYDKLFYGYGINRKQVIKYKGFNAIELSLVLAVIAIAIVATIRVMSGNSDKQNSNQMVNDVSTLVSNIKNVYSSSTTGYSSLTTVIAIDAKVIPQDLKVATGGSTIQNQFQGGTVDISAANNGEAFQVSYTNVPSAICNNAINTLGSSAFLSILINGTVVYDANAGTALDAANVASSCKSGAEKSTIEFVAS